MSKKDLEEDDTGNSEKDWEIFDVLCRNMDKVATIFSFQFSNLKIEFSKQKKIEKENSHMKSLKKYVEICLNFMLLFYVEFLN